MTTENLRYLCFDLGQEEFCIPLLSVREVLGMPEFTPIPQTPPHFLGIMNLRGQVISVIDLRIKMGIKAMPSEETAVVILDFGSFSLGMVVDRVNSVTEIPAVAAADKPVLDSSKAKDYIVGVYKKNDHLILILDISKALSVEEKNIANKSSSKAA